ncbi:MAG TPA: hypothetical protein VMV45_08770 [Casimicrobiaceae bacterium]|nr:hypothetical protein [Casimicrobiaceae bacterium]
MHDAVMEGWHDFFLLAGTAGVTLTGLLFVVVSFGWRVIAERHSTGLKAFITPNIYHLTAAFVVSEVLLAPIASQRVIGAALVIGGAGSLAYLFYTEAHRKWRDNQLPAVDWVWYVGVPWTAYGVLLAAGATCFVDPAWAVSGVGVCVVLLLLAGIRNAWDLIIWMMRQNPVDAS